MAEYYETDITPELAEMTDMYLKRVLINRKKRYYRERATKNGNYIVLGFETYENNLMYEEKGFDEANATIFTVKNIRIPIMQSELANAMQTLTTMQLQILLKVEVLGITTKEIAEEYGITQRMVCKHRCCALDKIKKALGRKFETNK